MPESEKNVIKEPDFISAKHANRRSDQVMKLKVENLSNYDEDHETFMNNEIPENNELERGSSKSEGKLESDDIILNEKEIMKYSSQNDSSSKKEFQDSMCNSSNSFASRKIIAKEVNLDQNFEDFDEIWESEPKKV